MRVNKSKLLTWIKNAEYIFIVAIPFFLPLSKKILPYLIAFLIAFWLFEGNYKTKIHKLKSNRVFYFIFGFYILHVFGILYSANLDTGLFDLQVKLSILFLPVIFWTTESLNKKRLDYVYMSFIAGVTLASLICIGNGIYNSFQIDGGILVYNPSIYTGTQNLTTFQLILNGYSYLNYDDLSVFHHPSYFSMYLLFAVAVVAFYIGKMKSMKVKIVGIGLILFFVLMIFLLTARAGIIAAFVLFFYFFFFHLFKKVRIIFRLFFLVLFLGLSFLFVINNIRFQKIIDLSRGTEEISRFAESNTRLRVWKTSLQIVQKSFFLGVGTGDIKDELKTKYSQNLDEEAYDLNLNCHNQFLETFVGQGLFGFILLILTLFFPLLSKNNRYKQLLGFFIIIVVVNFIFESMLNTIAGVVFFAYFYPILNLNSLKQSANLF